MSNVFQSLDSVKKNLRTQVALESLNEVLGNDKKIPLQSAKALAITLNYLNKSKPITFNTMGLESEHHVSDLVKTVKVDDFRDNINGMLSNCQTEKITTLVKAIETLKQHMSMLYDNCVSRVSMANSRKGMLYDENSTKPEPNKDIVEVTLTTREAKTQVLNRTYKIKHFRHCILKIKEQLLVLEHALEYAYTDEPVDVIVDRLEKAVYSMESHHDDNEINELEKTYKFRVSSRDALERNFREIGNSEIDIRTLECIEIMDRIIKALNNLEPQQVNLNILNKVIEYISSDQLFYSPINRLQEEYDELEGFEKVLLAEMETFFIERKDLSASVEEFNQNEAMEKPLLVLDQLLTTLNNICINNVNASDEPVETIQGLPERYEEFLTVIAECVEQDINKEGCPIKQRAEELFGHGAIATESEEQMLSDLKEHSEALMTMSKVEDREHDGIKFSLEKRVLPSDSELITKVKANAIAVIQFLLKYPSLKLQPLSNVMVIEDNELKLNMDSKAFAQRGEVVNLSALKYIELMKNRSSELTETFFETRKHFLDTSIVILVAIVTWLRNVCPVEVK